MNIKINNIIIYRDIFKDSDIQISLQAMIPITTVPAWRISFSLSEKILARSFTLPQRRCFLLVKVLLNSLTIFVSRKLQESFGEDSDDWDAKTEEATFSVSSFLLKHVMFWTLEDVDESEWRMNNLYSCVKHVLAKFEEFLRDRCVPHYFFGYKKNLIAGDIKMDRADRRKMTLKCVNMLIHLRHLRANMYPALLSCMLNELLDYQWTDEPDLGRSFSEMVTTGKMDKTALKTAVIEHHKTMVRLIKEAPRKYGRGVNKDLVKYLSKELDILESPNGTLEELDQFELADMQKEQEKPRSELVSAEQRKFWIKRAQMFEILEKVKLKIILPR